MGEGRELGTVASRVVIKLKERNSQQLHVLGHGEHFAFWHLDNEELFAFFRLLACFGKVRLLSMLESLVSAISTPFALLVSF